jgi:hypothetical protein
MDGFACRRSPVCTYIHTYINWPRRYVASESLIENYVLGCNQTLIESHHRGFELGLVNLRFVCAMSRRYIWFIYICTYVRSARLETSTRALSGRRSSLPPLRPEVNRTCLKCVAMAIPSTCDPRFGFRVCSRVSPRV